MSVFQMTAEEYNRLAAEPKKKPKYRNKRCVVDGIAFDSKKEARRWFELVQLQQAKKISGLKRQHKYELWVKDQHICDYYADAVYMELDSDGYALNLVIEDTKSPITRENPTYKIKKALVKAIHGIDIRET